MNLRSKWVIPALSVGVLSIFAQSSHAQWGGWGGWGGWGASTPMQGIGMGMGAMAMGAGQYNVDSAMARSMNVDTNLRISQAMWQQQHYLNWTNMLRRERNSKNTVQSLENIKKRIHEAPNESDIRSGNALNAILEDVTDPKKVHPSQLRLSRIPLEPGLGKQLPLFYSNQAVAFTIGDLMGEAQVPLLLRSQVYAPYRENIKKAMASVEQASVDQSLSPEQINAVIKAIDDFDQAFQKHAKFGDPGYQEAKARISAVKKMTKMLSTPKFEEILATVEKAKKANVEPTVTDLIGFMKHFNLRFGAATNDAQAAAMMDLFPKMDQIRDEVLAQTTEANPAELENSTKSLSEVLAKLPVDDKTPENKPEK
jgi:hypothetical protein